MTSYPFYSDPNNFGTGSPGFIPFTPPRQGAGVASVAGSSSINATPDRLLMGRGWPDDNNAGVTGSLMPSTPTKARPETAQIDPNSKSDLNGLDMSGFRTKNLPLGLFQFSFLSELRLANNFITRIPSQIGNLKNLQFLDLSNNQIGELPREFGWLTNLKELLLFNNHIQDLPAEMGFLFQLENLGLDGNPIINEAILTVLHSQGPMAIIPFLRDHMICTNMVFS